MPAPRRRHASVLLTATMLGVACAIAALAPAAADAARRPTTSERASLRGAMVKLGFAPCVMTHARVVMATIEPRWAAVTPNPPASCNHGDGWLIFHFTRGRWINTDQGSEAECGTKHDAVIVDVLGGCDLLDGTGSKEFTAGVQAYYATLSPDVVTPVKFADAGCAHEHATDMARFDCWSYPEVDRPGHSPRRCHDVVRGWYHAGEPIHVHKLTPCGGDAA